MDLPGTHGAARPGPSRLQFDDFEIDCEAEELRRLGERVELAPQAVRALAILASRNGELVRREELYAALWAGALVDVDRGLNTLIRQVRLALDDDPSHPRYLRTYPRRGYRFLVPVRAPAPPGADAPRPSRETHRFVWWSAVAAAIALLAFAAVYKELRSQRDDPGLPPEVRDTFLMATHLLQDGDLSRRTAAVPLLESVVSRFPAFAQGHGNLAAALFWAGRWDHARAAARKALSLDSGESTALLIEGSLALMIEWNWSRAESLLQRAVDRSPSDPVVLAGRAFVLITSGRSGEGMADLRLAQSVEPVAAWLAGDLGLMYLYAGDFLAAATACERAITLEPGVLHPLSCALTARLSLGDTTLALRHAGRLVEVLGGDQRIVPDDGTADRREALNRFLSWRVAHARQVLAKEPLAAFSAALVLAEAGQDVAALDALSLAASQRSPGLVTATVDPRLASLHATSAFHRIVAPLTAAGAGHPGRPLARKAQVTEGLPN